MAILVHPARATRDWLPAGVPLGGRMYHVLSDQLGTAGRQELFAFMRLCGIPTRFIQYPGTYREHFDAPPRYLDALLAAGGRLAANREVGELLRRKREALAAEDHE